MCSPSRTGRRRAVSWCEMTPLTFPIQTERLSLRPHQMQDAEPLHRIYSNPQVAQFLLDEPWTREDADAKVAERLPKTDLNGESGALALVIEHEGTAIGDVALWLTDREHLLAEIGWVLAPGFGGRGFAAEAAQAVLDLALDHYRVHRVAAQMDARNTASAKLANKIGMTREAHLRADWWSKGEWTDTVIFGMLATDRS